MKFEKRQLIIITVLGVMILAFVFFQYIPSTKAIKQAKQTKQQRLQDNEKALLASQQLPELKQRLAELRSQVGSFDEKLPKDRDHGSFLQEVTAIMTANNLSEQQVKPTQEISYEQINAIPVNMECKGSLENLFRFFSAMEKSQRVFNLDEVRFENVEYSGNIEMFAKGDIYYRN